MVEADSRGGKLPVCGHDTAKTFQCAQLTREECSNFYHRYCSYRTEEGRFKYIVQFVTATYIKRRRKSVARDPLARAVRSNHFRYYVPHEEQMIQVCRTTFTELLGMTRHKLIRIVHCFFTTGKVPVDRRGGDTRSPKYRPFRCSILQYLLAFRQRELLTNRPINQPYCIKDVWQSYLASEGTEKEVKYSFFNEVFSSHFDTMLNLKKSVEDIIEFIENPSGIENHSDEEGDQCYYDEDYDNSMTDESNMKSSPDQDFTMLTNPLWTIPYSVKSEDEDN